MARALEPGAYVYEGIWTNWGRGSVAGLTLTVNASRASVLSPAIAVLVSFAGIQLWRLVQYGLHQMRATMKPKPILYHQLQVTLRNTMTDMSTLWRLIRLGISWREWKPVFGLAIVTIIHFVLVLGFGLFSSWLLLSTDIVLSRSPWCGTSRLDYLKAVYSTNISDPDHSRLVAEFNQYLYSRFSSARQHVDICNNASTSCNVNTVMQSTLPWTSSYVADACPFDSAVCHPDAGTIFLDTGYLSSYDHLGFNAKSSDRVSIRMLGRCAPLDNINYTTPWQTVTTSTSTLELADAMYGRSTYNSRNATNTFFRSSYTCEQRYNMAPYSLTSYLAFPGSSIVSGNGTFDPIPELKVTDGDTSLMILGYNDAYIGPVSDPWFYASEPIIGPPEYCARSNKTFYIRERPLSALACVQQWQFCDKFSGTSANENCTPLLSITQAQALLLSTRLGFDLNAVQKATAARILNAGSKSSFFYLVLALAKSSSPPLKAQYFVNTVGTAVSSALPQDQWQQETQYWMDLILAYFQQNLIDTSTGQFVASTDYINVTRPSPSKSDIFQDALFQVCQNQMIRSSSHRNFNFPALIFVAVICIAIILIGLCLEDCIGCSRERRHRYSGPAGKGRQDMWNANSDLSMLRTIDELKHKTVWGVSSNGIPRTGPGYEVGLGDLLHMHPNLEDGEGDAIALGDIKSKGSRVRVRFVEEPLQHGTEGSAQSFSVRQQHQHQQPQTQHLGHIATFQEDEVESLDIAESQETLLSNRLKRKPHFAFNPTIPDAPVGPQYNPVMESEAWPWLKYSRLQDDQRHLNQF